MNIQQFQYILAVAEHRHFETAAEKCFITQSTLSTMIARFESEIGIHIFDRKTKPVGITKEGEQVIAQLKIINYEIDQLIEITKEIKGEVSGKLKIACIPTIAPYLLPLFLHEFSQAHPNLFIELKEATTDEIIHLLKSRDIDIGIVSTPIGERELIEYPLYQEPFVLFNMTKEQRHALKIADISWKNFWLLEEEHCMSRQVIEICQFTQSESPSQPNLLLKAGSIDSLIRFVKAYKGKTLLPYLATQGMPLKDQKYLSFFKKPRPKRAVGLLVHQYFTMHKTLDIFISAIEEKVKKIPELSWIKSNRKTKR